MLLPDFLDIRYSYSAREWHNGDYITAHIFSFRIYRQRVKMKVPVFGQVVTLDF